MDKGNPIMRLFMMGRKKDTGTKRAVWKKRWWLVSGAGIVIVPLAIGIFLSSQPKFVTAPEAGKIMVAQADLDFGILIPTYIPKGFDRETVELKVNKESGPSGEPIVDLTYRNLRRGAAIFFTQWIPGSPEP